MTFATKHNGGRLQTNPDFMQIGGEFPFLNCLKTAQGWSLADNSGAPAPSTLDSNGYPISISNGGVVTTFFIPQQSARAGRYVIRWTAAGATAIALNVGALAPTGSLTTPGAGIGRYEFLPDAVNNTDGGISLGIKTVGVSNLICCHVEDEARLDAGEAFGKRFKERLAEANFGRVRFLNWLQGNYTNVIRWKDRKPLNYVFYEGSESRLEYFAAGGTGGTGGNYTCAAPPSWTGLVDKACVMVKLDRSYNAADMTLNVAGTGAKPVRDQQHYPLSDGGNSFALGGFYAFFVYDAELGWWSKTGGCVAGYNQGLVNGAPPELCVQLCAEIGAHPQFSLPAYAADIASDWAPGLATYIRDNAPSWMVPCFEPPNEVFNFAHGVQTQYAYMKETLIYGWGGYCNWYGRSLSYLGQQISAVYSGDRSKYFVACGVQTAGDVESQNDRLDGSLWLASAQIPPAGLLKQAPRLWCNEVLTAQYWRPGDDAGGNDNTATTAFAAATSDAQRDSIVTSWMQTALTYSLGLTNCILRQAQWKAWAISRGIMRLCGYEGGYSADYTAAGTSWFDRMVAWGKRVPLLKTYTDMNYAGFFALNKGDFTADFPSVFNLGGGLQSGHSDNAWAVLEDIYQDTSNPANNPQWTSIVAYSTALRRKRWTVKSV